MTQSAPPALQDNKSISTFGAVAIGIGGMIGGGFFATVGLTVDQAKGGTQLAWAITACHSSATTALPSCAR